MSAMTTAQVEQVGLYDADFHAWCVEQAARLRTRSAIGANDGLDYVNLAEEIEALARSDTRAIRSHVRVLLLHLLKWQFQPSQRTPSCRNSIRNARREIRDHVGESPSLGPYPTSVVASVYEPAVDDASTETGLPADIFPKECPFSVDEIFGADFFPA